MTSPSRSSNENFLESLGISLEEANVTADADTHASVTDIYAQDSRIKLDVGESSVAEIPIEIFDHHNPVGAIISPSYLGYLRHFDMGRSSHKELLGALPIGSRLNSFHRSAPSQPLGTHSSRASGPSTRTPRRRPMFDPTSSTPVEGPSRAGPRRSAGPSRAPQAILEATGTLHPDLANLRLPYSIPYYPPDGPPAFREVSLESVDRLTLPSEDITEVKTDKSLTKRIHKRFDIDLYFPFYDFQVPVGLVNQMMELILGMQKELTSSWTHKAFDDQRRRRPHH
ncbi:hypothetical protein JCGZ_10326 [Jatropha curcas]|uniref:Uncharacterized protein n=1 Tax=Jatropha curcas TaxID=180498 RepID=A0A067KU96_JATCU|nr:hypothetical protein JCGZ_10326 [Jatropha curcas]